MTKGVPWQQVCHDKGCTMTKGAGTSHLAPPAESVHKVVLGQGGNSHLQVNALSDETWGNRQEEAVTGATA
eukprot:1149741-Pelagomonas_calceolata.AAC.8